MLSAVVAAKLVFSLSLGYSDIASDVSVAQAYHDRGMTTWFRLAVFFLAFPLLVQCFVIFFQYKLVGFRVWVPRVLLTAVGLAPALEGFRVWTGDTRAGLLDADQILALLKGIGVRSEYVWEGIVWVGI